MTLSIGKAHKILYDLSFEPPCPSLLASQDLFHPLALRVPRLRKKI